ncbi:CPSF A subunit region-domain-containing protein [Vararia minispora EC-137]|uniref:CPSF A subunit region-domain-containing protein n=1 Tax=Vararia minispora EC-137 TaxID=1314806 RepID=A0ACB8Q9J7_9AGAM|nr:CPSF A subunit region-domain-containing protein [Vararia minispora EC-137]
MAIPAYHQPILPPSGVEHAVILRLTLPTPSETGSPVASTSTLGAPRRALYNVVVARMTVLRIFEVWEEPARVDAERESEQARRATVRRGTEAVEGEVEMDEQGEGFVNIDSVKPTTASLYFVREHRLHGIVTGMQRVRVMASADDGLDRLLVSFKDAKIALLEWSSALHDLVTVSIHTYERTPQLLSLDHPFRSELRTDPDSRCAAMLLPKDSLAILPFYQTQEDIEMGEEERGMTTDMPYSPSFVLDLHTEVDERIQNVVDFVFLPGFHQPTIAVLFETTRTWTGRLNEHKDTMRLFIFTLDIVRRHYPVITAVDGLPYDCLSLLPCPPSTGGAMVLAANALIHIDQAGRKTGLAVNGWTAHTTDMAIPPPDPILSLQLECAHMVPIGDSTFFLVLRDGTVYPVELSVSAQVVSRIILRVPLARTTAPSVVCHAENTDHVFVGSDMGPSVLMRTHAVEEAATDDDGEAAATAVVDRPADSMDFDDDDIYGTSAPAAPETAPAAAKKTRTVIHAAFCDAIPAYGPIADLTFALAKNGERVVPELVTATGAGALGGFTLFQRDLPARAKRKLHAIGGARGMWAFAVRQAVKVNGSAFERPADPFRAEDDSIVISTDHNPSPGLSRISTRAGAEGIAIKNRIPGMTIGAAAFFNGTAILHVLNNAIRVLEPDGTERQIIKDMDGNNYRPKIKYCSICDPFVLILREDETIGLFIGEPERGKVRRKDMSPMGEKTSRYIAGSFYEDTMGLFQTTTDRPAETNGDTTTLSGAMAAGQRCQWLVLCRPQGVMEIWALPKLTLVFSSTAIAALQSVIADSHDPPALSVPQPDEQPRRKPQEFDIEQILIAPLGEAAPQPHLLVFLRSGHLAIYQMLPAPAEPPAEHPAARTMFLGVRFVKLLADAFDIVRPAEEDRSVLAEQRRISRQFVPFTTYPPGSGGDGSRMLSGVFFTGDRPSWIVRTDKGGLRVHPSGHAVVHSFTTCSLWGSKSDFLIYSEEGPTLLEWAPDLELGTALPSRAVPRGRAYSHIVFDPAAGLLVAAACLQADFSTFDEENNEVWVPEAPNASYPKTDCSALELITPEGWIAMDGYDFASNEFVNAMACVALETQSTDSGKRNYIAVGTTVNRGEDLAVKGATYVFEIVEVVPDPAAGLARAWQLRLRCRDDAKGPVTAVCGINNYLVSSMGQKIFVRAFDLDERLVGVAFLDVGVYVTALRAVKNLLLIGDAVKSVWFVAFQEDPYKLVVLSKDVYPVCVTAANFFFTEQALSFVTHDEEGVLRMYQYDPHDPESKNSLELLCRAEFHTQAECRATVAVARRSKSADMAIPQSKLICAHPDGSLSALIPLDDEAFKRLHLLQGQLSRHVQHLGGLNPRAFRSPPHPHPHLHAAPRARGLLDGALLGAFGGLGLARQDELTRQIGTERAAVVRDLGALAGAW